MATRALTDIVQGVRTAEGVIGIDLSEDRLQRARNRIPSAAFVRAEGSSLPFPCAHFDLVLTFTVFSSVLDDELVQSMASEVERVLRPGGTVLWYDMRHANPWNHSTRAMGKSRIHDLFQGMTLMLEPVTLLPPLARRLGPATSRAYGWLRRLPGFTSHYLGVFRKPTEWST